MLEEEIRLHNSDLTKSAAHWTPEKKQRRKDRSKDVSSDSDNDREVDISEIYTNWSRWSRCSRKCKQKRERRCAVPSVCGREPITAQYFL